MDQPLEIDRIIAKYVRGGSLTSAEQAVLSSWLDKDQGRRELLDSLRKDPARAKESFIPKEDLPENRIWSQLESRLQTEGFWLDKPEAAEAIPVIPVTRSK